MRRARQRTTGEHAVAARATALLTLDAEHVELVGQIARGEGAVVGKFTRLEETRMGLGLSTESRMKGTVSGPHGWFLHQSVPRSNELHAPTSNEGIDIQCRSWV